jgi:hypothetical protein
VFVYQPDKWQAGLGIPGTSAYVQVKNWLSIIPTKNRQQFEFRRGIFGEPFLEMSTDSSEDFEINLLQSSPTIEQFWNLFDLQKTGVVGFPFSLLDTGKDSNFPLAKRQKTFYWVAWLPEKPRAPLNLTSTPWVIKISCASGGTIYI